MTLLAAAVVLEGVLRLAEQRTHVIEQRLGSMHLLGHGGEAGVARQMPQRVRPAALQLHVVVDLLDHLLELSGIHSVGAHKATSCIVSRRAPKGASPLPSVLAIMIVIRGTPGDRKGQCEKFRKW